MRGGEKLLLLAHPRSGSSNLYEILQMHPALELCDEPFNKDRGGWEPENKNYREQARDWSGLETALDEIFESFNGLKLLSYQLPVQWVIRLIQRSDFRVLFVRRRNLLQTVVSVLIAEQTGLWHRWDTNRAIETYYTALQALDITDLRARLRRLSENLQRLELALDRQPVRRRRSLIYEEFFFDEPGEQTRAIRALWTFLDLDPITSDRINYFLRPERSKLNSPATYRLLPNADEIERQCGCDATGHLF